MLVRRRGERPGASLRSRRPALVQAGAAGEALETSATLVPSWATELVDTDRIGSEARQVDWCVDGHAVG